MPGLSRRIIRRLLFLLAASAIIAALAFLVHRRPRRSAPTHGDQLARTYCQSCHLFPEPALLDKASWTNGTLPDMAPWLGLVPPQLERLPNGEIVPDSNVFPPSPLIPRDDWDAIVRYYAHAAPERLPRAVRGRIEPETKQFRVRELAYARQTPMTLMAQIDAPGRRLYVGDALTHTLEALDVSGKRIFAVEFDSGPVSVMPRRDSIDVTLVGRAFPSDLLKGKLLRLRPSEDGMNISKLLGNLRRPVHSVAADLNGDGHEDFVICQFGNRKGQLSWFEGRSDGTFEEHILLDRPGAIRAEVRDMNHDGRPDIIALMGQAWEGVYLFLNEGGGRFAATTLLQQHPAFGYSHFELVDFDKDGDLDLLTTNGDNGETAAPPKPYHGIRIYLNDGANHFTERWFYPMHGVYGARVMDFDLDGDLDIAAISYFPDYLSSPEESFVYLESRGNFQFKASSIPQHADGRWITIDAGDLDGDGDPDIVLGSLVLGPTSIPIPATILDRWKSNAPAILFLENTAK